ncbi:MAG TPA: Rieske 2Fe-2S domain-containing protein [Dehalococcoidia bacterium]|nr:Rieske 2Fe-2S domain-containing protein [Dehalococcoidia bacterium]
MADVDEGQAQEAEDREERGDAAARQAEKPAAEKSVVATPAPRGGGRAMATAGGHAVVVAEPRAVGPALPQVSRRGVLRIAFWTGMGAMLVGIVATIINSLYPRHVTGFGGKVFVGTVDQLEPGKKIHNLDAKAWIVRFDDEQARRNPPAQAGMIMALYHKCVHLGCTVPYRPEFVWEDPRNNETYQGWFRCPCHGSTYSDAGVRVFGPAPRSLDTFALTIDGGKMTVDTGKIKPGNPDNPSRAIPPA